MIRLVIWFIKFLNFGETKRSYELLSSVNIPKTDFYFWHLPTYIDSSNQYFTVTVEKAIKHIVAKSIKSTAHRGRFIVLSSSAIYLKKSKKCSNLTISITTPVSIQLFVITAPLYQLVVTYAIVNFFLHVTERFIRKVVLFVII